jgi:hypothetical protein
MAGQVAGIIALDRGCLNYATTAANFPLTAASTATGDSGFGSDNGGGGRAIIAGI